MKMIGTHIKAWLVIIVAWYALQIFQLFQEGKDTYCCFCNSVFKGKYIRYSHIPCDYDCGDITNLDTVTYEECYYGLQCIEVKVDETNVFDKEICMNEVPKLLPRNCDKEKHVHQVNFVHIHKYNAFFKFKINSLFQYFCIDVNNTIKTYNSGKIYNFFPSLILFTSFFIFIFFYFLVRKFITHIAFDFVNNICDFIFWILFLKFLSLWDRISHEE